MVRQGAAELHRETGPLGASTAPPSPGRAARKVGQRPAYARPLTGAPEHPTRPRCELYVFQNSSWVQPTGERRFAEQHSIIDLPTEIAAAAVERNLGDTR